MGPPQSMFRDRNTMTKQDTGPKEGGAVQGSQHIEPRRSMLTSTVALAVRCMPIPGTYCSCATANCAWRTTQEGHYSASTFKTSQQSTTPHNCVSDNSIQVTVTMTTIIAIFVCIIVPMLLQQIVPLSDRCACHSVTNS